MRAWDLHDNCMTCSFQKCRCAHRICLNTNYQLSTNCYYTVTFMLQPAKMHGGARNCYKRRYSALHAQLCTLRAQDQLENLTNCPLLIATHSDSYASTLKNPRESQKSQKEAFWPASRAIVRTAGAGSA